MKWKTKRTIASLLVCITLLSNTNYVYAIDDTNDVDGRILNEQTIENGNDNSNSVNIDKDSIENTSEGSCEHNWVISYSQWEQIENSSYKFVQSDNVWTSNNKNRSNSTASTTFKITVDSNTQYELHYGVNSEKRYDELKITFDSNEIVTASGSVEDSTKLNITKGEHTLILQYSKDGSGNTGKDCGWVTLDNVEDEYVCSLCGEKCFHDDYGELQSCDPTCTEEGGTYYECKLCGRKKIETTIEALGHDCDSEVVQERTALQDGITKFTCKRCGYIYNEVTKASCYCEERTKLDGDLPYNKNFVYFCTDSYYNSEFAIDSDGNIWGWGENSSNKLLDGDTNNYVYRPTQLTQGAKFVKVVQNSLTVYGLTDDGTIWRWGCKYNYGNYLTNDSEANNGSYATEPEKYESSIKFKDITSGYNCSYFVAMLDTDGNVYISGQGYGVGYIVGDQSSSNSHYVEKLETGDAKFKKIDIGQEFLIGLTEDGDLWAGGYTKAYGAIADGQTQKFEKRDLGFKVKDINAAYETSYVIDEKGDVYAAGKNNNYSLGINQYGLEYSVYTKVLEGKNIKRIDGEYYATGALSNDGKLYITGTCGTYVGSSGKSQFYEFTDITQYLQTKYKVMNIYTSYTTLYYIDAIGDCYTLRLSNWMGEPDGDYNYSYDDCRVYLSKATHAFNEVVTKEPTCTEKGTKKLVCTDCGLELEVEIPKIGHNLTYTKRDTNMSTFTYTLDIGCTRCNYSKTVEKSLIQDNLYELIVNTCDLDLKAIGKETIKGGFGQDANGNNSEYAYFSELNDIDDSKDVPLKKVIGAKGIEVGLGYDGNLYSWGNIYSKDYEALRPKNTTEQYIYKPSILSDEHEYVDLMQFTSDLVVARDIDNKYYVFGTGYDNIVGNSTSSTWGSYKCKEVKPFDGLDIKGIAFPGNSSNGVMFVLKDNKVYSYKNGVFTEFISDHNIIKLRQVNSGQFCALADNGDLIMSNGNASTNSVVMNDLGADDFIMSYKGNFVTLKNNKISKIRKSGATEATDFTTDKTIENCYVSQYGYNELRLFVVDNKGNVYIAGYNNVNGNSEREEGTNLDLYKLFNIHTGEITATKFKDKTCTTPEIDTFTCSVCGSSYNEGVGTYDHEWEELEVIEESQFGVFRKCKVRCKVCGLEEIHTSEKYDTLDITDWKYTLDEDNDIVNLVEYIGANPVVNVHSYYYVPATQKWYYTELNTGSTSTFHENTTIEEVTIDPDTKCDSNSIANLFENCTNLRRVYSVPSCAVNYNCTFNGCTSLEEYGEIPSTVIDLNYTFQDCTSLVKVEDIPRNVVLQDGNMYCTFYNCTSLEHCPGIPLSVTEAYKTFYNCSSMKDICDLGPSLDDLNQTFYNCRNMEVEKLKLNNNIRSMNKTFAMCNKIKSIGKMPTLKYYKDIQGNADYYYMDADGNKSKLVQSKSFDSTFMMCEGLESITLDVGYDGKSDEFTNQPYVIYKGTFYGCNNIKDIYVTCSGELKNNLGSMLGAYVTMDGNYIDYSMLEDNFEKLWFNREDLTFHYDDTISETYVKYASLYDNTDYCSYTNKAYVKNQGTIQVPYVKEDGTLDYENKYIVQFNPVVMQDLKCKFTRDKELSYDENGQCKGFYREYNTNANDYDYTIISGGVRVNKYIGKDDTLKIPSTLNIKGTDYKVIEINSDFMVGAYVKEVEFDPSIKLEDKYTAGSTYAENYANAGDEHVWWSSFYDYYSSSGNTYKYYKRGYSEYESKWHNYKDTISGKYIGERVSAKTLLITPYIEKIGYIPDGINIVINESRHLKSNVYLPSTCLGFDDRKVEPESGLVRDGQTSISRKFDSNYPPYTGSWSNTNNLESNIYYACNGSKYESQLIANVKAEGYEPIKSHRDANKDEICDYCHCLLSLTDWDNHLDLDNNTITLTMYLGESKDVTVPNIISHRGVDYQVILDASYYTFYDTPAENVVIEDGVQFGNYGDLESKVIKTWMEDKKYGYPIITYYGDSVSYYKNLNTFKRSNIKNLVLGNTNITNFSRLFSEDTTPIETIKLPDNLQVADFMFFSGWYESNIKGNSSNLTLKSVEYDGNNLVSARAAFAGCVNMSSFGTLKNSACVECLDDTFYGCASMKSFGDILPERAESLKTMEGTFRNSGITTFTDDIPVGVNGMYYTFMDCDYLETFDGSLPGTLLLMESTFRNDPIREIVDMPSSVQNIKLCYYNCRNLTAVDSNVTNMSSIKTMQGTFIGCTGIQTVDLSQCTNLERLEATFGTSGTDDTIEEISEYTTYIKGRDNWYKNGKPCTALKSVILPNNGKLENMDCAFAKCSSLSEISTIPNTVESVVNTFYKCTELKSVKFAENNEKLYKLSYAFYKSGLQELEINTDSSLAAKPFNNTVTGCTSLKKMTVNIKYMDSLSNLGSGANIEEFYFSSERLKNLDYAFKGWKKLRVTSPIPSGVVSMVGTFEDCDTLEECPSIPDTVLNMSRCFYDCDYLVHCPEIGNNVEDMSYAFYGCDRLVDAKLGLNALKNTAAFAKCISLSEIEDIDCTNIRKLDYTFAMNLGNLNVSDNVLNNTGVEDNTPKITKMPSIGDGVEDITGIFAGQTKLVEVSDLPSTVNKLEYAFYNCKSLVRAPKVTNKNIVTMYNAFSYCKSLENVEWDNINTIEQMESAFKECESLKEFNCNIGKVTGFNHAFEKCTSLKRVGTINDVATMYGTFKDDTELETVDFGTLESLTSISEAFSGCSKLNDEFDFTASSRLSNVEKAFYNCTSLVEAPEFKDDGAIDKMHYTFYGCSSLKEAKIPNSVTDMRRTYTNCTSLATIDKFPDGLKSLSGIDGDRYEFDATIPFLGIGSNSSSLFGSERRVRYYDGKESQCYWDTQLIDDIEYAMNNFDVLMSNKYGYEGTFSGCTSLEEVPELPNSLLYMNNAFVGCTKLRKVGGDTYTTVGEAVGAFLGCNNLEEAKINISSRADYTFTNCKNLVIGPKKINGNCAVFTFANCKKLKNLPEIINKDIRYWFTGTRNEYVKIGGLNSTVKMVGTFYNCKSINGTLKVDFSNKQYPQVLLYRTFENCESLDGTVDLTWYRTSGIGDSGLREYRDTNRPILKKDFKAVSPFKGTKITGVKLGPVDLRYEDTLLKDLPTLEKIEINNDMRDASEDGMDTLGYSYRNSLRNMVWNDDIRGYKPTSVNTSLLGYLNIDTWNAIGRTMGGCDDKAGYSLRYDEGLDAEVTFNIVGKNATAKWYNISNLVDITNDVTKSIDTDASGEYFDLVINTSNTNITPQRPCIYLVETELIDPDNYALFNNTNRYSLQVGYESQTFGYSYVANNEEIGTKQVLHVVKKDGSVPNSLTVPNVENKIVKINKIYYAAINMDSSNLVNSTEQIVREDGDESSSDYDKLTTTLSFRNLDVDQDDSYYLCYITTNDGVFQTFANPVRLNVNDLVDHLKAEYKGDKVPYGDEYNKDDVEVKAYYDTAETDSDGNDLGVLLESDYWEVEDGDQTVSENGVVHDNYISDTAVFEGAKARYEVPGYWKVDHIEAEYTGEEKAVGDSYDPNDVVVNVFYKNDITNAKKEVAIYNSVASNKKWHVKDGDVTIKRDELTPEMSVSDNAVYLDEDGNEYEAEYKVTAYLAIDHMTAEYIGEDIPVGNEYNKDDVVVTLYYSDDKTDKKVLTSDEWSEDSLTVSKVGENIYTATYRDIYQEKEANYSVDGFKLVHHIKAEYNGPEIAIGEQYNKNDVTVTICYNEEETDCEVAEQDSWEVKDGSLLVNSLSENEIAVYKDNVHPVNNKEAGYVVPGYKVVDYIEATYIGEAIPISSEYNKDEVEVYVKYVGETEKIKLDSRDWEVKDNSLVVNSEAEEETAVYDSGHGRYEDTYEVPGYHKIVRMTAEHPEEPVEIGSEYNKADVDVRVYYLDGGDKKLETDEWEVEDGSLLVNSELENEVAVHTEPYNGRITADYHVNGVMPAPIVDHITAEYKGADIQIVGNYNKDDVEVKVYYSNYSNVDTLRSEDWTESSLEVREVGENVYTATYEGKTDDYKVNGKDDKKGIKAEYKGTPIRVGDKYNKEDVEVYLEYMSGKQVKIDTTLWSESGLDVTEKGTNSYTATYDGMTDTYEVDGIDYIIGIEAEYKGEDVPVKKEYNKDDVEVKLLFKVDDPYKLKSEQWNESSLVVDKVGDNEYVATYEEFTDTYNVIGTDHAKSIYAEYKGEDIPTGNNYNKDDVEVTVNYYEKPSETVSSNDWSESSLLVSKVGKNDYLATYEECTDTYEVTGLDHEKNIEAIYKGDPVQVGEKYNKDDVEVKVNYYEKDSEILKSKDWKESSLDVVNTGENKYTATYKDMTSEYTVEGKDDIDKIEARYTGEPVNVKEEYKKEEVEVKVVYKSGKEETLKPEEWKESSLVVEKVGDNEYKATYKEFEDTYVVEGKDHIKDLSATYVGDPVLVSKNYDKNDVKVVASYYEKKPRVIDSINWKESSLLVQVRGSNVYTATYDGMDANYNVTGIDNVKGIDAEYTGEPVPINDEYDKEDVEVKLVYENSDPEIIDTDDWTESSLVISTVGENKFTATYKEFEDDYTVIGYDDTITVKSIKGTYPEKVLVGEEFKEYKAKIVVTYSDGTKQKLKYKYLDVKPESKEVKQVGDNKYTIGYKGAEGSLIVEGYDVDKIIAKYDGPNIEVGKDYSKRDVTVTVIYTDGSEKKLGIDEFETSSMTVTKEGENSYDATWKNYIGKFSVIGVISRPSEKIVDNSQPKTGDRSMLWLAIIVMVSSVIILLYELRKRISYKKK